MSILRKIEAVGCFQDDHSISERKTVIINTTGVGLPSSKHKIAVGETYSFTCGFNVPALTPSMNVPGLLETCYMVNIAVGRAHNFVIASLRGGYRSRLSLILLIWSELFLLSVKVA
ncbi:hypothetical protein COOONC_07795 [Cooperia oncophora]